MITYRIDNANTGTGFIGYESASIFAIVEQIIAELRCFAMYKDVQIQHKAMRRRGRFQSVDESALTSLSRCLISNALFRSRPGQSIEVLSRSDGIFVLDQGRATTGDGAVTPGDPGADFSFRIAARIADENGWHFGVKRTDLGVLCFVIFNHLGHP